MLLISLFYRSKLVSFASSNALIISSYLTNVSAIVDITSLYRSTSSNVESFNLNSIHFIITVGHAFPKNISDDFNQ